MGRAGRRTAVSELIAQVTWSVASGCECRLGTLGPSAKPPLTSTKPSLHRKTEAQRTWEPNDQGQSWVWIASSVCPSCLGRTPGRKAPWGPHAAPEAWTGRGNGKPRPCRQLLPLATSLPKERRRIACVSSSQRPGGSFAKSKM